MKTTLMSLILACSTAMGLAQGQLNFNNLVVGSYAAPIFGPELVPLNALQGQPANNPNLVIQGSPAGTTVYHGAPLAGTGFTAQLWGGPSAATLRAPDPGTGTQTFSTAAPLAGYLASGVTAQYAGIAAGSTITLQVRAWDNQNGTITSWAMVMANLTIAHGVGATFQSPSLTVAPTPPMSTPGMSSFSLVVPEPSGLVLGALGLGAWLMRRRK